MTVLEWRLRLKAEGIRRRWLESHVLLYEPCMLDLYLNLSSPLHLTKRIRGALRLERCGERAARNYQMLKNTQSPKLTY